MKDAQDKSTRDLFFRTPYNYDRSAVSDETGLRCDPHSMTDQSYAEEVDINTIMRRFGRTGELPQGVRMPTYADFEGVVDFHTALNAIAQAGESFDRMPAEVRARFENDPGRFVDFCSDVANRDEAVRLGLVPPPEGGNAPGGAIAAPGAAAEAGKGGQGGE